jgi:acetyl esterase/lipase
MPSGAASTSLLDGVKYAIASSPPARAHLRIDPGRIGIMGGSAGGYLAAMVALTASEPAFATLLAFLRSWTRP